MRQEQRNDSRDAFLEHEARIVLDTYMEKYKSDKASEAKSKQYIQVPSGSGGKLDIATEFDKNRMGLYRMDSPEAVFALAEYLKTNNITSKEAIDQLI